MLAWDEVRFPRFPCAHILPCTIVRRARKDGVSQLRTTESIKTFPSVSAVVAVASSLPQHTASVGMNINMIEDGPAVGPLSQHPHHDQNMSNSSSSCSAGVISDFNFLSNLVNDYNAPPEYYQLS